MTFEDSHGNLWETCSPRDPEAKAFGPRGSAKPVPPGRRYGREEYLLEHDDGWTVAVRRGHPCPCGCGQVV